MLKRIQQTAKAISAHISLLTFALLGFLVMVTYAINTVETTNAAEKKAVLEEAIMRSALHCYSLEGAYPDSIDYLTEHYSLSVDESVYIVHYEWFASNIAPDVTVIVRNETEATT